MTKNPFRADEFKIVADYIHDWGLLAGDAKARARSSDRKDHFDLLKKRLTAVRSLLVALRGDVEGLR